MSESHHPSATQSPPLVSESHHPSATQSPRTIPNQKNLVIINTQSVSHRADEISDKKENQPIEPTTDRQTEFETIKLFFEERLSFDDLRRSHRQDKSLDEIELNILEMYFNEYTTVKGEKKPQGIVRSALMKLTYWHIEELLSKYKNLTMKIKNPKSYMQAMIYNIAFESDLAITNQVQHDFYG